MVSKGAKGDRRKKSQEIVCIDLSLKLGRLRISETKTKEEGL